MTSPVAKAARSVPSLQEFHADPSGLRWHLLVAKPANNVPTLLEFHADPGGLRWHLLVAKPAHNVPTLLEFHADPGGLRLYTHALVYQQQKGQGYYQITGLLRPC